MAPFTIIAHRGHQGRAPENTLQAFQAALDAGYPHFELDVQLTSCGTAIVLHDEHLGRTVPGSGPVADNSWEELKDKDAGSWVANVDYARLGITDPASSVNIRDYTDCRIPTLTAVLDAFLGKAHIHLELKSKQAGLPAAVKEQLVATGWVQADGSALTPAAITPSPAAAAAAPATAASGDAGSAFASPGLTITSFHLDQLKASKALLPGVRHAWLVHELGEEQVQAAVEAGLGQLCPRADLLLAPGVALATAKGLSVRAWGLGTDEKLLHAVRCGAQGGTLNYPDKAAETLRSAGVQLA